MQFALVLAALELRQKTYNVNAKMGIEAYILPDKPTVRMA
jgi:hypothetical protein